jgi:hypothetical protein
MMMNHGKMRRKNYSVNWMNPVMSSSYFLYGKFACCQLTEGIVAAVN